MPIFRPRKFTFFPFLILFKRIESIDMTPCVISFLVKNSVEFESPMLHVKFQDHRTFGPREEDF